MTPQATQPQALNPQPGPQTAFLESDADIVLYGGSAGSGGTHGLLLHCLKHIDNPAFRAVIFCRERSQIKVPGGLWDNARDLFKILDGVYAEPPLLRFRFRSGAIVHCCHLEHENAIHKWQGSKIPLLCFDGLTQFTMAQFLYMLSRNRSAAGIKPLVRATCHPDPDSWVADLIAWWIDADGYPIPERSGAIRHFVVEDGQIRWGCSENAKSFTFISASVFDNGFLLGKDPGWLTRLKALGAVEQARLLGGNWKIRPNADQPPSSTISAVRGWDLAATEPIPGVEARVAALEARVQDLEAGGVTDAMMGTIVDRFSEGFKAFREFVGAPEQQKPNLAKLLRETKPS